MAALMLISVSVLSLIYKVSTDNFDVGCNTIQMIKNHGYLSENHYITTEDGYILTYQRIPHGRKSDGPQQRPPVLLMHGLASSSADWVNMGTTRSLSFILADLGYDVWIGNARGNAWSRNHTTLDVVKDAEIFYDFSWHEIGYYDLPAAVDYILSVNGDDRLHYVGYSQGGTAFFVFASTRPEYNKKIRLASLLAPATIFNHHPNVFIRVLSEYIDDIEALLKKYKIYEIPYPKLLGELTLEICSNRNFTAACEALLFAFVGEDYESFDPSLLPVLLTNLPSNAGARQFIHYFQLVKNGEFSQYDFGIKQNLEKYGTERPPVYDFSKVTAPVAIYYGKSDGLVPYKDMPTVIAKIPNVVKNYLVPFANFNHIDFIVADIVKYVLYNEVTGVMQNY